MLTSMLVLPALCGREAKLVGILPSPRFVAGTRNMFVIVLALPAHYGMEAKLVDKRASPHRALW